MAHHNTVFSQLLKLISRHEFESLAKQHHSGRSFRTASRWSQFVTMAMAQLSGRDSLRDIAENISAQAHRLYHLGSAKLSRSNLSRINEDKPYALYRGSRGQRFKGSEVQGVRVLEPHSKKPWQKMTCWRYARLQRIVRWSGVTNSRQR